MAALVAVVVFSTLGGVAAAEPPPSGGATCPPGQDCEVRAERPAPAPPAPAPGNNPAPGPTEPPLLQCNIAALCPVEQAPPQQAETAQDVALREFAKIPIKGPQIGIVPGPEAGKAGLVGLPVWLWTAVTPQTWGPFTATATVPGLTVTATATAVKITWNMGDGHQVTCTNPGTPYQASYGNAASPDCGYRYTRSSRSQPGGRYTVTGTTNWVVNWAGGGQTGTIPQTRQTTTTIQIDELQVVTQ
ncbi:ATP/GTP-binding protein [Cryptosporangium phraense]|uniref:ATP/GTP-binding protein n=1 Tax=Cryptosporangium phraense TaxID=2593070 RepID=A0A545ASY0_9ACTN|nr:ATP/GTP-binding protein [Cryptosporangium phraense]TQS44444.1 ATP/GTP-binding protein [Cryptosporangium phraense]